MYQHRVELSVADFYRFICYSSAFIRFTIADISYPNLVRVFLQTVFTVERLYDITRQPAETEHERWFQKTYGKAIEDALHCLKTPTNPSAPHSSWLPFKQVRVALFYFSINYFFFYRFIYLYYFIIIQHWAAVVSRGWAKASACRLQVSLSCADHVAPVFVQVVSPPLGWSPLSSFLVIWSPSGDTQGPSVVFEAVDMAGPGPFHFSHIADYIYDFCPLPDLDVGLSILVRDVEHTSFQ